MTVKPSVVECKRILNLFKTLIHSIKLHIRVATSWNWDTFKGLGFSGTLCSEEVFNAVSEISVTLDICIHFIVPSLRTDRERSLPPYKIKRRNKQAYKIPDLFNSTFLYGLMKGDDFINKDGVVFTFLI